jgi:hypothetical protein
MMGRIAAALSEADKKAVADGFDGAVHLIVEAFRFRLPHKIVHRHGAGREEVSETVAVAVYMSGGPATVYGADAPRAHGQFAGVPPQHPGGSQESE